MKFSSPSRNFSSVSPKKVINSSKSNASISSIKVKVGLASNSGGPAAFAASVYVYIHMFPKSFCYNLSGPSSTVIFTGRNSWPICFLSIMFFTDHFVMQLHMNEFFYHAAVSFFYKDEKNFNLALFYCQRQTFFESIINVCRTKISAEDPVDREYWHNLQFG